MKTVLMLSLLLSSLTLNAALVVYPDYPSAIERDDAYLVKVTQDDVSRDLVVWNHCEKSILNGRTHGGDVNRRFCEFAFSGSPVRVDIAVREDVKSYAIFPSRLGLKNAFRDGVISVWLDRPENFGVRLNDYDKSILSVLADAPEVNPPKKGSPGVVYVDGWVDATNKDGVFSVTNGVRELYLAPGSVLNARVYVTSPRCRIRGRGIVLDPMSNIFRFNQSDNTQFGTFCVRADDVTVEDIKLLDARTFNWIFQKSRTRVINTKTFSSMMCSDGMSFFSGRDVVIDHAWVYSGDNGLVIGGTQPLLVRNTTVGTSCAAIFPQSSFRTTAVLENVSVFRSDEGLINNYYNGREPVEKRRQQTIDVRFNNFSAVDTVQFAWIFQGKNMGRLPKRLVFDNASFPEPSGVAHYNKIGQRGCAIRMINDRYSLPTANYHLFFTNLFVGGTAITCKGLPPERIQNAATNEIVYAQRPFANEVPLLPDRYEVNWRCPVNRLRKWHAVRQTNLVAETRDAHSIWQRCPSYRACLEAMREEDGSPVYLLSRVRPQAGMQAILTDELLSSGNGVYRLRFEARAQPVERQKQTVLTATLLSNETKVVNSAEINTEWTACDMTFKTEFKSPPTQLVSLMMAFPKGVDKAEIRRISLMKE